MRLNGFRTKEASKHSIISTSQRVSGVSKGVTDDKSVTYILINQYYSTQLVGLHGPPISSTYSGQSRLNIPVLRGCYSWLQPKARYACNFFAPGLIPGKLPPLTLLSCAGKS